ADTAPTETYALSLHDALPILQTKLSVAGQVSGRPLISNEQFSIGGWDSVRGYYESQELGDDGVSGQFNLESPSWHNLLGNAAQRSEEHTSELQSRENLVCRLL